MRYLPRKRILILSFASLMAILVVALAVENAQVLNLLGNNNGQDMPLSNNERDSSLNIPNNGKASVFVNVKRFPSDVPEEVVDQIVQLELAASGAETSSPSINTGDSAVNELLTGTQSGSIEVQVAALDLLADVIKGDGASQSEIDQLVRPAMDDLVDASLTSPNDEEAALLKTRAERVIWQADLSQLSGQDQLTFLEDNLENTSDGSFYYSFEAIDQLADVGSGQAKTSLENLLSKSSERSIPSDILKRTTFAVEKVNAILDTENLDSQQEAEHLANLIASNKGAKTLHHTDFLVWLVGRLEIAQTSDSVQVLNDIWNDDSYDLDIRAVAQESLVSLGEIAPEDRTIINSDF